MKNFLPLLCLLLIVLKVTGLAHISWLAATSLVWLPFALFIAIMAVIAFAALVIFLIALFGK